MKSQKKCDITPVWKSLRFALPSAFNAFKVINQHEFCQFEIIRRVFTIFIYSSYCIRVNSTVHFILWKWVIQFYTAIMPVKCTCSSACVCVSRQIASHSLDEQSIKSCIANRRACKKAYAAILLHSTLFDARRRETQSVFFFDSSFLSSLKTAVFVHPYTQKCTTHNGLCSFPAQIPATENQLVDYIMRQYLLVWME